MNLSHRLGRHALSTSAVVAALVLALGTACDESTSGAEIVAIATDAGADAAPNATSDAAPIAPGREDAGPEEEEEEEGGSPPLAACTKCAIDKCSAQLEACGPACANAAVCIAGCNTVTCQDECARGAATPLAVSFKACLATSCTSDCAAARLVALGVGNYAQVDCAKFASCFPVQFLYRFRSLTECQERAGNELARAALLPASGFTGTQLLDCALATSALSCEDYLSARARWACPVRGARPNGEPCSDDTQCESGLCPSVGLACATCAATPLPGAACAAGDRCGFGMTCTSSHVCAFPVREGDACDATKPCEAPFYCDGTCQAAPAMFGALCGSAYGIPDCDYRLGYYCSSDTDGTCLEYFANAPGEPCGAASTGQLVCLRAAACNAGTCASPPTVGQACNDSAGPRCTYPEQCVAAKCTAPPPANGCK